MEFDRETRQMRTSTSEFLTREEDDQKYIEGYFAVFNSKYDIAPGLSESIAPGAFDNTLSGDIRALINHDTTLVLGRTKARTLELKTDSRGLWGRIQINPNDQDAMNLYERVKRGDVDQCSFGFDIVSEETEFDANDNIHWTITEVRLYEVSCCTFPAYEATSVSAREADLKEINRRKLESRRAEIMRKLKGEI